MRHRLAPAAVVLAAAFVLTAHALTPSAPMSTMPAAVPARANADPQKLVVHEWGTFTSIAAEDGSAMMWVPQQGPADLPCFVRNVQYDLKGWLLGTVRMETPVLYFYAPRETTVDVKVRFKRGAITEWYPNAEAAPARVNTTMISDPSFEGSIAWKGVRVLPGARESFPTESSENHYYVARRTDASPVLVGSQSEKFLFYRGVGNFPPPLRATIARDGRVSVSAVDGQPAGDVILFANRRGTTTFRAERIEAERADLAPLPRPSASSSPRETLVQLLVKHGLYVKEARAMVDTWQDSWFEDGTRLFYVMSKETVDALLPLEITPAPDAVSRVFVGRLELISQASLDDLKRAIDARERAGVARYGRFLRPMLERLGLSNVAPRDPAAAAAAFAYQSVSPAPRVCQ